MGTPRPKPQSLRPLSSAQRRWFWVLMILGFILIAVGWSFTIRGLRNSVPEISSSLQEGVTQASEKIEETQIDPEAKINQAERIFQILQQEYKAEHERQ
jgi:hypothetical protein